MFSLDRFGTAIPFRSHGESRPDKNGFTPIKVTAPRVVESFSDAFRVRSDAVIERRSFHRRKY